MKLRYTGSKPEKEAFQVFGETMEELFKEDPNVVYLDADLMGSLKTTYLWKEYPKNVFNCGIQEADMVGVACGMYINGMKPYIHTFTPFASRRVFDQAFLSIAYGKKSVRIIGSDAGIMATHNGGTHMCFEDVAMMRSVPNACVIDVTDPHMLRSVLKMTKDRPGLTYIRTARRDLPDIYLETEQFEEGKAKILREGENATVIASGIMVQTALQAAESLEKEGIAVSVVDPVTIKPLDKKAIVDQARKTGVVVTAENANIIGGLGSAVTEVLAEEYPCKVIRIGVNDQFGCVGTEPFLREHFGLTAEKICDAVKNALK